MAQQTSFQDLLVELNACKDAKEWAGDKTWEEVHATCHRGDWLLWLYKKTNPDDLHGLTLAKGLCANTVRNLMKDQRSINAVDAAIAFGKAEISIDELYAYYPSAAHAADSAHAAYAAAYAAAHAAAYAYYSAAAAHAAAHAAPHAADSAHAAAYAYYSAAAAHADPAHADAYAADCEKKKNRKQTADIVRSVLPIEKWDIKFRLR